MLTELRDFVRHAAGVRRFLGTPLTEAQCLERLRVGVERREDTFVDTVARGVFGVDGSPYRSLFVHAGVELGDLRRLVAEEGVDGALERLYDAGVRVSIDEFRGRRPIERPGLSHPVGDADFDNPLVDPTWRATTGGSRSLGRRVLLNVEHLEQSALYHMLFLSAHGALERPEALWRPFASRTAANNALRSAKRGRPIEKWFSQTRVAERPVRTRDLVLSSYALLASRLWAPRALPRPEYVPFAEAVRVARWLEAKASGGNPALLIASVGSATRIAMAASDHGLEIGGTLFRSGGEPLTPGRAAQIRATGSSVFADYSMAELGRAGVSCAAPAAVGDVHLMVDKVAVVQRARVVPTTGETVAALSFTTLLPSAPKLMINVETDDYAVVEDRACGCAIGELGYGRHLHTIRSYEKLTSEGVTMRGADVLALLERTLPGRFGGGATDYQLVESVDETLPTLSIVISPRVGEVDERAVVELVLDTLASGGPRAEEASQIWRGAGTLQVVRREPYVTSASKVLPIHVRTRES